MTGHESTGPIARQLCDALHAEMAVLRPGIARDPLGESCALYLPGNKRFAYLFHAPNSSHITVFFRSSSDVTEAELPEGVSVPFRQEEIMKSGKRFRLSLKLTSTTALKDIAKLLSVAAYPLSLRKSQRDKITIRPETCPPEEVLVGQTFAEGNVQRIVVNRYERDLRARNACISRHGTVCSICGFDFAKIYGEVMAGFTHVHHLKPLATVGEGYQIDPVCDLRPVCPNCHAVIHRREPPYSIEEVQQLLRAAADTSS